MACTYRDSTLPVSSIVSPRPSCMSEADSTIGVPPASAMATSNETRVRVEGFSKIRAMDLPSSAVAADIRSFFTFAEESSK